jgi:hypothetical protein
MVSYDMVSKTTTRLLPGNSVLSNSPYQGYKHRESAARGFQVLPSSDTTFLVTTSRGAQYIVSLPPITPDRLQGSCSCRKYDDFSAPCSHTIACILYLHRDPFTSSLDTMSGISYNAHTSV